MLNEYGKKTCFIQNNGHTANIHTCILSYRLEPVDEEEDEEEEEEEDVFHCTGLE